MTATALHDTLTAAHASLEEYSGTATAADFGDPRAEFAALLSGCALYDLGWRARIEVTGQDRTRWLNGMISNNIRNLGASRGVYSFLLNPQGHILGDLYAYNRGDSLLLETDQSQQEKILTIFRRYIIMDKVQLENADERIAALGGAGPKAVATLAAAGISAPELAPLQLATVQWRESDMTLVRGDNPAVPSFQLWVAPAKASALWDALRAAGAVPVGTRALELYRIAAGIPRYDQDIHERDLPQETGQERALNFSKGCYIGQEIVERIRSRGAVHRQLTGFLVEGELPAPGTKIELEGKQVGEITSAAMLPLARGDRSVALGYLRHEAAESAQSLQAGASKLTVADFPFAEVFPS